MKQQYQDWISANITPKTALAKCKEWTAAMQTCFPELTRVRGHIMLSSGYERQHWWLTDTDGEVVDPTEIQYTDPNGLFNARVLCYTPLDESQPEPTGVCPNCSGYCYNDRTCCSESCERAYTYYCMHPETL